jgi:5-methylcytosine-specific restriction endonuclease McrA
MRSPLFMKRTYQIYRHQAARARKAGQHLDYDLERFREWVEGWGETGDCYYCAGDLTEHNFSVDHRVPTSRGGTYLGVNVVLCCKPCNEAKGNLTDREFGQLMSVMFAWDAQTRQSVLKRLRAGGRVIYGK